MADLNFVSPGATASNAIAEFLNQRAAQQRQAMLDSLNAKAQAEQQARARAEFGIQQSDLALRRRQEGRLEEEAAAQGQQATANAASAEDQRNFTRANTIHQNALPGATTQDTYDLLNKYGMGEIASKVPGVVSQGAQTGTDEQGVPQYAVSQAPDTFNIAGGEKYQAEQIAAKQKSEEAAAAREASAQQAELNRQSREDLAKIAANKPDSGVIGVQTVGPNGEGVTQYMTKADALKQGSFAKPQGQTVQNRIESAKAVQQTGQDIINKLSDPEYAKGVGMAMGRYNSVRDFIGNPPPEYADLAGNIESYALANMGVHGMRSAQGAEQIKRMLDQKHTPEALIAAVKGLNNFSQHFIENTGGTVPQSSSTGKSSFRVVSAR